MTLQQANKTPSRDVWTSWPGEHEPAVQDVQEANEVPDYNFLKDFRNALFATTDSSIRQALTSAQHRLGSKRFDSAKISRTEPVLELGSGLSYPASILSDFPPVIPRQLVQERRACFFRTFKNHVFLRKVPINPTHNAKFPPSLEYAFVCFGEVLLSIDVPSEQNLHSNRSPPENLSVSPTQLFFAGSKLDVLLVETDNRQSRSINVVLSVSTDGPYQSSSCH